jgi:hypothetical protein
MTSSDRNNFRVRDVAYLIISIVLVGVGYAAYRGLYFVGEDAPFAQEMILVFLGAAATIYLTAVLLNRQTELELRKEGQVLLFHQKHEIYMRAIEKVAEIVERERHDAALIDELRVINHKLAVVGSTPVVEAFRRVLGLLVDGLVDGQLNNRDAEQVMHAVADVTIAMRSDIIGDSDSAGLRSAEEAIMANSRRIERLDDIERSFSRSDTNADHNEQKKGDPKNDART